MQLHLRDLPRPSWGSQGRERTYVSTWKISVLSSSWYLLSGHWEGSSNVVWEPGAPRPGLHLVREGSIKPQSRLPFPAFMWPPLQGPTTITTAHTSGSFPWKRLPFSLLPSPWGQLSWLLPRRMTRGQQDLARERPHSLLSGPDLQVGLEVITSAVARAARSSETFQSSQESAWDKYKVLANFKCS